MESEEDYSVLFQVSTKHNRSRATGRPARLSSEGRLQSIRLQRS